MVVSTSRENVISIIFWQNIDFDFSTFWSKITFSSKNYYFPWIRKEWISYSNPSHRKDSDGQIIGPYRLHQAMKTYFPVFSYYKIIPPYLAVCWHGASIFDDRWSWSMIIIDDRWSWSDDDDVFVTKWSIYCPFELNIWPSEAFQREENNGAIRFFWILQKPSIFDEKLNLYFRDMIVDFWFSICVFWFMIFDFRFSILLFIITIIMDRGGRRPT